VTFIFTKSNDGFFATTKKNGEFSAKDIKDNLVNPARCANAWSSRAEARDLALPGKTLVGSFAYAEDDKKTPGTQCIPDVTNKSSAKTRTRNLFQSAPYQNYCRARRSRSN
jgi:hypothetical protein